MEDLRNKGTTLKDIRGREVIREEMGSKAGPLVEVILIHTGSKEARYPLGRSFTGRFILDFNLGGLAGVEVREKLK